jgi:hypothetical protein
MSNKNLEHHYILAMVAEWWQTTELGPNSNLDNGRMFLSLLDPQSLPFIWIR